MKEYWVKCTKPRKGKEISNVTMCKTVTQKEAEDYLHNYIVGRLDVQNRYVTVSDDQSTYYNDCDLIVYQRPEGYQCGAPFWFDDWNLEMFRIHEVENA